MEELLRRGHSVIGFDNLSKYGPAAKLGFEATNWLSDRLDEGIPWIAQAVAEGAI